MMIDEEEYRIKPMNCPFHVLIYKTQLRSYRELPIRYFELGTVYRYERSGVLHGLLRVRGFTQDDAHIICTPEQIEDEVRGCLDLALFLMKTFGYEEFKVDVERARPAEYPEVHGQLTSSGSVAEGRCETALASREHRLQPRRGRRGLLRPED